MKNNKAIFPYNKTNPVIYDNDSHCDVYTDELLLALSSAGEIDLRGFITTTTVNPVVNLETYELDYVSREGILNKARRSGMKNIPRHFRGPSVQLIRPYSGNIEDTVPIDTPGSRLVLEEALKATPEKPLVLLMGGPLTVAADAWLLDNSISDRIIVAWLGGNLTDMYDYNSWADVWAAYIVLMKMRLVEFPVGHAAPVVLKSRLAELPDCELRQWMMDKRLPHVNPLPDGLTHDGDAQPVISLLRRDYALKYKSVSFGGWGKCPGGEPIPVFKDDPEGTTIVVVESDGNIATVEWWKAVKNPSAWGSGPRASAEGQRPFYAAPFPVGRINRIEAEDFDRGGRGTAYHKHSSIKEINSYRDSHVRIIPAGDIPGGYNQGAGRGFAVAGLKSGEWLEYTVDIEKQGIYDISVRASSVQATGCIHIEFDGIDKTGPLTVHCTGAELCWETIQCKGVELKAGRQVMRLYVEDTGNREFEGNFNYFRICRRSF